MADLRRCIGSARFGIESHEAPIEEFPTQPSQKDGYGRMCTTHWRQYTAGLARDAKARKAAEPATQSTAPVEESGDQESPPPQPPTTKKRAASPAPTTESEVASG